MRNQAQESAVKTAASQIGRRALNEAAVNNDLLPDETTYRTDLALQADTPGAVYDYFVNDTRKAFCLSVTDTTIVPARSFAVTQNGQTVQGRCVKNYATDPDASGHISNFSSVGGSPAATFNEIATDRSRSGPSSFKRTIQGTGQVAAISTGMALSMQTVEGK